MTCAGLFTQSGASDTINVKLMRVIYWGYRVKQA